MSLSTCYSQICCPVSAKAICFTQWQETIWPIIRNNGIRRIKQKRVWGNWLHGTVSATPSSGSGQMGTHGPKVQHCIALHCIHSLKFTRVFLEFRLPALCECKKPNIIGICKQSFRSPGLPFPNQVYKDLDPVKRPGRPHTSCILIKRITDVGEGQAELGVELSTSTA